MNKYYVGTALSGVITLSCGFCLIALAPSYWARVSVKRSMNALHGAVRVPSSHRVPAPFGMTFTDLQAANLSSPDTLRDFRFSAVAFRLLWNRHRFRILTTLRKCVTLFPEQLSTLRDRLLLFLDSHLEVITVPNACLPPAEGDVSEVTMARNPKQPILFYGSPEDQDTLRTLGFDGWNAEVYHPSDSVFPNKVVNPAKKRYNPHAISAFFRTYFSRMANEKIPAGEAVNDFFGHPRSYRAFTERKVTISGARYDSSDPDRGPADQNAAYGFACNVYCWDTPAALYEYCVENAPNTRFVYLVHDVFSGAAGVAPGNRWYRTASRVYATTDRSWDHPPCDWLSTDGSDAGLSWTIIKNVDYGQGFRTQLTMVTFSSCLFSYVPRPIPQVLCAITTQGSLFFYNSVQYNAILAANVHRGPSGYTLHDMSRHMLACVDSFAELSLAPPAEAAMYLATIATTNLITLTSGAQNAIHRHPIGYADIIPTNPTIFNVPRSLLSLCAVRACSMALPTWLRIISDAFTEDQMLRSLSGNSPLTGAVILAFLETVVFRRPWAAFLCHFGVHAFSNISSYGTVLHAVINLTAAGLIPLELIVPNMPRLLPADAKWLTWIMVACVILKMSVHHPTPRSRNTLVVTQCPPNVPKLDCAVRITRDGNVIDPSVELAVSQRHEHSGVIEFALPLPGLRMWSPMKHVNDYHYLAICAARLGKNVRLSDGTSVTSNNWCPLRPTAELLLEQLVSRDGSRFPYQVIHDRWMDHQRATGHHKRYARYTPASKNESLFKRSLAVTQVNIKRDEVLINKNFDTGLFGRPVENIAPIVNFYTGPLDHYLTSTLKHGVNRDPGRFLVTDQSARFHCFPALGWKPSDLDAAFSHGMASMDPFIFTHGDDVLVVFPRDNAFYEADLSACDRSLQTKAMNFENNLFKHWAQMSDLICCEEVLFALKTSRATAKAARKIGPYFMKLDQRPTGSTRTSVGNTILVLTVFFDLLRRHPRHVDFSREAVPHCAQYGISITFTSSSLDITAPSFLKGLFLPSDDGRHHWYRMPSALLKMSKCTVGIQRITRLHRREIVSYDTARKRWLGAMCMGNMTVPHIPAVREFVVAHARDNPAMCAIDRFLPYGYDADSKLTLHNPSSLGHMLLDSRYNLSQFNTVLSVLLKDAFTAGLPEFMVEALAVDY